MIILKTTISLICCKAEEEFILESKGMCGQVFINTGN